ncbi:ionic transporter y4hA [Craurococcus roseus]|uniref:Ionic transporter y4hA n=2 Tax=Craurococcus roseus TaxID=77585 RepID=A0ABP3Q3D1_9PROT
MAANVEKMPWWAWVFPALAWAMLGATTLGLVDASAPLVVLLDAALLGGTVFAAVHHAEVVAARVGEPFGSLVLAVAVTVIEVALIVSLILSGGPDKAALARDTVFAAVMIVCNGIVGLCLLSGGARHGEQGFQVRGAAAALAVLATLATLALVLPNHTLGKAGPVFTPAQLVFVGVVSLVLYGVFVFVQTIRHRDYFLSAAAPDEDAEPALRPSVGVTFASLALLVAALAAVVLLAKTLSPALQAAVDAAGLPAAVVGVAIAALVLMPEGLAAVRAARADRLQTSLNLALGSALATIGLTIPTVAAVSLLLGFDLVLGLDARDTVLLVLTLFVAVLTLGTGRTTVLQGAVHLVIFAVFLFLAASP